MNFRVKQLDNINLISNSDCHSLDKLARECNVFDCDLTYDSIYSVINTFNSKDFLYTVEFYPEEGRYHYDGHRDCKICLTPEETKKNMGLCPKCGKPVVVGVLNRVEELAGRTEEEALKIKRIPFKYIIPLKEILGQIFKTSTKSLKVINYYDKLIERFSNELDILLKVEYEDFVKNGYADVGDLICKMRKGEVEKIPGYDGEYGIIKIKE
jgi:PHP family Zn ribbon phosphoesterase